MYCRVGQKSKKQIKRWFAGLLCAVMMFEGAGMQVLAETTPLGVGAEGVNSEEVGITVVSEDADSYGTTDGGDVLASGVHYGMAWFVDNEGELTISGEYDESTVGTAWSQYRNDVTSAKVTATGVKSTKDWFSGFRSLRSVDFSEFDTSQVVNMDSMFMWCSGLTNLELSNFNTENVTDMSDMFYDCTGLTSLDLSSFNMGKVESASFMLRGCTSLETIKAPINLICNVDLWGQYIDEKGAKYVALPKNTTESVLLQKDKSILAAGTFYGMDWIINLDGALTVSGEYNESTQGITWGYYSEDITSAKITATGVTSTAGWFGEAYNLESVDFSEFDTSQVTNMEGMFSNCSSLIELDVSGFDTSQVTNMCYMFECCNSVTSLDLSNFDTSQVTNMEGMFFGCNDLERLNISNFDTSQVTSMYGMFSACESLISLDVSHFNTSNVTSMGEMFERCNVLTRLDVSGFDTSKVTDMSDIFCDCESLTSLDVSNFVTGSVSNMDWMFGGCKGLKSLDLNNFDTSQVTSMEKMFYECESLSSLDLSSFDMKACEGAEEMLVGCAGLETIKTPSNLGTDVVLHCKFEDETGEKYTELPKDCASLLLTKAEDVYAKGTYLGMDWQISNEGELTISGEYDTSDGEGIFWNNYGEGVASAKVTATGVEETDSWFSNMSRLNSVDLSEFDTSEVKNMYYMFRGCSSLTELDLSNFDTGKVESMWGMFQNCSSLTSLDLSSFDTAQVIDMDYMFRGCSSLVGLDLSSFDLSSLQYSDKMLTDCTALETLKIPKNLTQEVDLPDVFVDSEGMEYMKLPINMPQSITLAVKESSTGTDDRDDTGNESGITDGNDREDESDDSDDNSKEEESGNGAGDDKENESESNYEIIYVENADELVEISDNVAQGVNDYRGYAIQINNNIDLSQVEWIPIGKSNEYPFRGSIQGNGYIISGLNCAEEKGGLIGYWDVRDECYAKNLIINDETLTGKNLGGLVANLSVADAVGVLIENVTIDGAFNGKSLRTGGLIGETDVKGTGRIEIIDCNINISMDSGKQWNDAYAALGGVVGRAIDDGSGQLVIRDCTIDGTIVSVQDYGACDSDAGGLIGKLQMCNVKIEQCSRRGSISCKAYLASVGGLIGCVDSNVLSKLEINNCYVIAELLPGTTNATTQAGGIIGHVTGSGGDQISIYNSYVAGSMTARNKAAFVCWMSADKCPEIRNCYFDSESLDIAENKMACKLGTLSTTWLSNNISNSGGYETAIMKTQANYVGWDFENVWTISSEENAGYPILQRESKVQDNEGEDTEEFNLYMYRAEITKREKTDLIKTYMDINSPSRVLSESLKANSFDENAASWEKVTNFLDTLEDPTTLYDLEIKEKDVYSAIILDMLEATTKYDVVDTCEFYVKDTSKLLSTIKMWAEDSYAVDIANANEFKNLTAEQQEKLVELTKAFFKDSYDEDLDSLTEVFSDLSKILQYSDSVETYVEKVGNCLALASLDESMKNVLRTMYEKCPTENVAMRQALLECVEIVECSFSELIQKIIEEGVSAVGVEAFKYLVDKLWDEVKNTLSAKFPGINMIRAAYKASKFFTNSLYKTDATIEKYHKMKAVLELEELIDSTYLSLLSNYELDKNPENAAYWLSSIDLVFAIRDQDCIIAYELVDTIDQATANKMLEAFNRSDEDSLEDLKKDIASIQGDYYQTHEGLLTSWIYNLEDDYPDSGLYEKYSSWFKESEKRVLSKEYVVACPVDVYIYDSDNNCVAYVENNIPHCAREVTVGVSGDVKTFWFYGTDEYRMECIGNDSGDMDITITEYEDDTSVRTVCFYELPLEKETHYETQVDGSKLEEVNYSIISEHEKKVVPDYDSLGDNDENTKFELKVNSGVVLGADGPTCVAQIRQNETVEIEAYVADGYVFAGWESDAGVDIFQDLNAQRTTLQMPDKNVVVSALLKDTEGNLIMTDIILSESELVLEVGATHTLNATSVPQKAENIELHWSSSNEQVVTVNEAGQLVALAVGQCVVEVSDALRKITDKCVVTVVEKRHEISFDSCGGSSVDKMTDVLNGHTITLPLPPTRENYIFMGWYTEKNGQGVEFTEDTAVTDDMVLYAYWIPEGIWVRDIQDAVYTGKNVLPAIAIYDGKKLLKEKTHYTISYKNNKAAYTYTDADYTAFEKNLEKTGKRTAFGSFNPKKAPQITIKMKGNYSGSQTIYFRIEPADITGDAFEVNDLSVTHSGKKQTPAPTLTWNGKKLKYNTDFYIPEYDKAKADKTAFTVPGTYKLTVMGKKNFTGQIPITLTISKGATQIAMSKVTVKGVKDLAWTGTQLKPTDFTVSYKKDVLSESSGDYTVSWGANTDVGTGTIIFTGTGEDTDGDGLSYIGTKRVSFKITGSSMSKVSVAGVEKSYSYTGAAIEPTAKLTYQAEGKTVTLVKNTHYTVSYQKNLNKGTATVLFTGLESAGYTGTKKQTFKIVSGDIGGKIGGKEVNIGFADNADIKNGICIVPYMKGGAKPEIIVTCGENILKAGTDYTVSYTNNKSVALSTDAKAPTVTVKGKGNYTGSKSVTFTIAAKALSNENGITVVAKDKVESTKANGYAQKFTVYDADGKALGSSDYDSKNVTYTLIQTMSQNGTVTTVNQVLDENSIVPANSVIQIAVQGKGVYAGGTATGTYRILENGYDISKATIQINNQEYTGSPVLITEQSQFKTGKVYIKVGKEKRVLTLGKDFEVVPDSYVKNVDKGTAKVTLRGINEYGGTKTVSFKIGTRSIEDFWKGIYSKISSLFD